MSENFPIPDIQGKSDKRGIAITRVGVRDVRVPLVVESTAGRSLHTVARAEMTVSLPHDQKGTHMSRFIDLLTRTPSLSLQGIGKLHGEMLDLLHAEAGTIGLEFPFFLEKAAPVSGVESLLDYEVRCVVEGGRDDAQMEVEVTVPVTSLCPCSKEISRYGAHNQRSHIVLAALYDPAKPFSIEELIVIAENAASCPLWSLLKRADEKYVTEYAYDNAKFVEDIVRDVAIVLDGDDRIQRYRVFSENLESIHNHSACALIERDKR